MHNCRVDAFSHAVVEIFARHYASVTHFFLCEKDVKSLVVSFFIPTFAEETTEKQTPRNSEREENAHYYVHHYTHACLLRLF